MKFIREWVRQYVPCATESAKEQASRRAKIAELEAQKSQATARLEAATEQHGKGSDLAKAARCDLRRINHELMGIGVGK